MSANEYEIKSLSDFVNLPDDIDIDMFLKDFKHYIIGAKEIKKACQLESVDFFMPSFIFVDDGKNDVELIFVSSQ